MMATRAVAAPRTHRGGLRFSHIMLIIMLVVLGILFIPTTIVVTVGLLPAAAAFVFDQDVKRSHTLTITLMNGVGVLPFVLDLWKHGQTLTHSIALIEEPVTLLVMYGAAGIGWLIYFIVPHLVQLVLAQRARLRIAELEEHQAELRRLWGEDIRQKQASL